MIPSWVFLEVIARRYLWTTPCCFRRIVGAYLKALYEMFEASVKFEGRYLYHNFTFMRNWSWSTQKRFRFLSDWMLQKKKHWRTTKYLVKWKNLFKSDNKSFESPCARYLKKLNYLYFKQNNECVVIHKKKRRRFRLLKYFSPHFRFEAQKAYKSFQKLIKISEKLNKIHSYIKCSVEYKSVCFCSNNRHNH